MSVCGEAEALPVARDLCVKLKPEIVLLDPAVGDGFGFIKELPRWSALSRVVVLTGLADALSVQRAFKAGAYGYVTRLDPLPALLMALLGAAKGERHMGPGVELVMLKTLASGEMELRGDAEAVVGSGRFTDPHLTPRAPCRGSPGSCRGCDVAGPP